MKPGTNGQRERGTRSAPWPEKKKQKQNRHGCPRSSSCLPRSTWPDMHRQFTLLQPSFLFQSNPLTVIQPPLRSRASVVIRTSTFVQKMSVPPTELPWVLHTLLHVSLAILLPCFSILGTQLYTTFSFSCSSLPHLKAFPGDLQSPPTSLRDKNYRLH